MLYTIKTNRLGFPLFSIKTCRRVFLSTFQMKRILPEDWQSDIDGVASVLQTLSPMLGCTQVTGSPCRDYRKVYGENERFSQSKWRKKHGLNQAIYDRNKWHRVYFRIQTLEHEKGVWGATERKTQLSSV